ncbi:protein of unknown function [Rhodovastum atsumiense]|nr:hypothetical protein [Rhodovastum atsumiense]CAH2604158.1 protein of unknown function [Rhodovastum atsumiense]
MSRVFLIVVLVGAVLFGAALLTLGAFPPTPVAKQIQKVLPNDRFAPRGG